MRQIKFRAWDKIENKYFYDGNLDNGDVMVLNLEGGLQFSASGTYKQTDFILEQFAGVTDSEGVQIYEGDIVDDRQVVFEDGNFNLKRIDDGYQINICLCPKSKLKVIGNIHQTKEAKK